MFRCDGSNVRDETTSMACPSKRICHCSRSSAKRHLKRLRRRDNFRGDVFHCVLCRQWHVCGKGVADVLGLAGGRSAAG